MNETQQNQSFKNILESPANTQILGKDPFSLSKAMLNRSDTQGSKNP